MRRRAFILLLGSWTTATAGAQVRLTDASDRAALRDWFLLLADAQFYRPTADVTDCAALVRYALREALRAHTPDWRRRAALPHPAVFPDVRATVPLVDGGLAIFRVNQTPPRFAEFADAKTIVRLNATPLGRDVAALRPGDLLYFHQPSQRSPDHLMIYLGPSRLERDGRDWIVYHTGPDPGSATQSAAAADEATPTTPSAAAPDASDGEMRKVRLVDLLRHPAPRWRPVPGNASFVGVFRLELL